MALPQHSHYGALRTGPDPEDVLVHCQPTEMPKNAPKSDPELEFWKTVEEGEDSETTVKDAQATFWRGRVLKSASGLQLVGGLLLVGAGLVACAAQETQPCRHDTRAQLLLSLTTGACLALTGAVGLVTAADLIDINCAIVAYCVSSSLSGVAVVLLVLLSAWNLAMHVRRRPGWVSFDWGSPDEWPLELLYQGAMLGLALISCLNCLVSICFFCCRSRPANWWVAVGNIEEIPTPRKRRQNQRDAKSRDGGESLLHEE